MDTPFDSTPPSRKPSHSRKGHDVEALYVVIKDKVATKHHEKQASCTAALLGYVAFILGHPLVDQIGKNQ